MAVKIADIKTQKEAGGKIAKAIKLLIRKAKEERKKNKVVKGREKLTN